MIYKNFPRSLQIRFKQSFVELNVNIINLSSTYVSDQNIAWNLTQMVLIDAKLRSHLSYYSGAFSFEEVELLFWVLDKMKGAFFFFKETYKKGGLNSGFYCRNTT